MNYFYDVTNGFNFFISAIYNLDDEDDMPDPNYPGIGSYVIFTENNGMNRWLCKRVNTGEGDLIDNFQLIIDLTALEGAFEIEAGNICYISQESGSLVGLKLTRDCENSIDIDEESVILNSINEKAFPIVGQQHIIEGAQCGEYFNDYQYNKAFGLYSHAEGQKTTALGGNSHSEGHSSHSAANTLSSLELEDEKILQAWNDDKFSLSKGDGSHVEGYDCLALGHSAHAEGRLNVAEGDYSHSEGYTTLAIGNESHSEGLFTAACGVHSHAEGQKTTALGGNSHSEGYSTDAPWMADLTTSEIIQMWQEDYPTNDKFSVSKGDHSHVEGRDCLALGNSSHAENRLTMAEGNYSHSEGWMTRAQGNHSHAEGYKSAVRNMNILSYQRESPGAHAEGYETLAVGVGAHSEGSNTIAAGDYAHAGGYDSQAGGNGSFVHGQGLQTLQNYQTCFGQYNEVLENAIFMIGNGTNNDSRSNAFWITEDGKIHSKTKTFLAAQNSQTVDRIDDEDSASVQKKTLRYKEWEYGEKEIQLIIDLDFGNVTWESGTYKDISVSFKNFVGCDNIFSFQKNESIDDQLEDISKINLITSESFCLPHSVDNKFKRFDIHSYLESFSNDEELGLDIRITNVSDYSGSTKGTLIVCFSTREI